MPITKSKYKIEKDIPIPKDVKPYTIFPFQEMKVGDSFFVSMKDFGHYTTHQTKSYIYTRAKKFNMDTGSNFVFSFKRLRHKKGVRCFRVK